MNKIQIRITFKIKAGYYLGLLTPETMKLLGALKINYLRMKMVKMYLFQKLLK